MCQLIAECLSREAPWGCRIGQFPLVSSENIGALFKNPAVGQGALRASMSCFGIRAVLSAAAYRTLIQVPVQVPIPSKCQSTDMGTFPETKLVLSLGYGFQNFIAGQAFGTDYPGKQADPFQMPPCGHTVLENYPRHV